MEFIEYIAFFLILGFAGFTQGLSGFGSTLVALPFLILFMDIKTVVPLMVMVGASLSFYLILHMHKHIPWKKLVPFLIATFPGIVAGVYLLKNVDSTYIQILLGTVLVIFSVYMLVVKPVPKKEGHSAWSYVTGFLSGALGSSIAASGPPIIIHASLQPWGKDMVKSLFVTYFFLIGIGIFISHVFAGLITKTVLFDFGLSIPAFMFGTWLGHCLYKVISEAFYRKMVLCLLLALGIFTTTKAILSLAGN
jgi:uncharacterized membrane protein YfcA